MSNGPPLVQPPQPDSPEPQYSQAHQPRENPYVGPRALREGERIFGRDRELRELLNRLIADRLVLLYSPSGAGKSSLVQAGVAPQMRKEKFAVLPTIRVGLEPSVENGTERRDKTDSDLHPDKFNRYILSALLALEQDLPAEQQQNPQDLTKMALHDYLARRPRAAEEPSSRLLVFDQFEDILTQAPLDRDGKLAFFEQVGEALLDHDLWALFVIREDFLAGLDPYLPLVPTYLRSTFRLDLLESHAALLAIQKPVGDQGIQFKDEAAHKLVDDLRRVWVQQPDGSQREQPGLYVEPVQMQVVCRRLYKELNLANDFEKTAITEDDVARLGDVNKALGEYYGSELSEVAARKGLPERDIRNWFAERLITENLLRGQVLMGEGASGGLDNEAIRLLEDAHLVRAESRRNATWFELAHDRLVRPILEDNQAWAETHLQEFQRRAAEWRKKNRPSTMLLRGRDLLMAEEWAQANPTAMNGTDRELIEASREQRAQHLSPAQRKAAEWEGQGRPAGLLLTDMEMDQAEAWLSEHLDEAGPLEMEFIAKSRHALQEQAVLRQERELQLVFERQRAEQQAEQNQKLRRRNFWLAGLAALATLVFLVALYFANQYNTLARNEAAIANTQSTLAARNATQAEDNAIGATAVATDRDFIAAQAEALEEENTHSQQTVTAIHATSTAILATSVSLATQSSENAQGRATAEYNANLAQASRLASLSQGNFGKNVPLSALLGIAAYQAFPQSWEGRNALLTSLQVNTQQQVRAIADPIESQIRTLQNIGFNQDGRLLAWSGLDGKIRVWDLGQNQLLRELQISPEHGVNSLAFSPTDPNLLVGGSGNGYLTFWNLETGEGESIEAIYRSPEGLRYTAGRLLSLAFSPNGDFLGVAGLNGNVQIWDAAQRQPVSAIDTGSVTVRKLVWSPDGDRLAGAAYDLDGGAVYIWDPFTADKLDLLPAEDALVFALDWSLDGDWLAFAGGGTSNPFYQRKIVLHNTQTRQQIEIPAQGFNIRTLAFDQDSKVLAAGSDDGTLRFWDISLAGASGTVQPIGLPFSNFITRPPAQGLAISPGGPNRLAYFTNDGRVAVLEIGLSRALNSELSPASVNRYGTVYPNVNLDPVSGLLAIGAGSGEELFSLTQQGSNLTVNAPGSDLRPLRSGEVLSAALGPGGLAATGDESGRIRVWDTQNNAVIWEMGSDAPVLSLAISQNGKLLAAGWCLSCNQGSDAVGVYEIGSDSPAISFQSDTEIHSLAFSPRDAFLAGGDSEGKIQLWDIQTQDPLGLAFAWDQANAITVLAISSDGNTLASGSHQGGLGLWDIGSRQQIGQNMRAGEAPVTGLLFAPDGLSLVSATQDGEVQRWELDPGSWIKRLCELADRDFTAGEIQEYGSFPVCKEYLQQPTGTPGP